MRRTLYDKRLSTVQTDSIDFTKTNKITPNVKQLESSEKSKMTRVVTSASFTGKTEIHSSGTD